MPDRGDYVAGQPPEREPHKAVNGGLIGVGRDLLKQVGLTGERLVLVVVLFVFLFFIWLYLSQDRAEIRGKIDTLQKSVDIVNENLREGLRTQARVEAEFKAAMRLQEFWLQAVANEMKRIQGKPPIPPKPDEPCP